MPSKPAVRVADVVVLADDAGGTGGGVPIGAPTRITSERRWVVGRSPESDIVVNDSRVSRQHLVIEPATASGTTSPHWFLRDVSSNGSWAAGRRVEPAGVAIPVNGELRVNLGDRAGPQLVFIGQPASIGAPGAAAIVPPPAPQRRRHRRRGLAIALVALLAVLVGADRLAAHLASTEAVKQVVKKSQGLAQQPSVSFGGFPFLTQVAFGKYSDIQVKIDELTPSGGPRIESVTAHLKGAHIPLSHAIHGTVTTIPVDKITATVAVRYADLNAFLAKQAGNLVLAPAAGGAVSVSGHLEEAGIPIDMSGTAKLSTDAGMLTITPTDIHASGNGGSNDPLGLPDLGDLGSIFPPIPVPLVDLPYHLAVTSVRTSGNGIAVSAQADHIVLDAGP